MKKAISKSKSLESSREDKMMVLLEDMRGEIHAVAEGHSDLKREIKKLRNDLNDFKEETRDNFKLVFEHFSNIEDEILEIKSEIKELRQQLCGKADLERLTNLEERVRKLEERQLILGDKNSKKYK